MNAHLDRCCRLLQIINYINDLAPQSSLSYVSTAWRCIRICILQKMAILLFHKKSSLLPLANCLHSICNSVTVLKQTQAWFVSERTNTHSSSFFGLNKEHRLRCEPQVLEALSQHAAGKDSAGIGRGQAVIHNIQGIQRIHKIISFLQAWLSLSASQTKYDGAINLVHHHSMLGLLLKLHQCLCNAPCLNSLLIYTHYGCKSVIYTH